MVTTPGFLPTKPPASLWKKVGEAIDESEDQSSTQSWPPIGKPLLIGTAAFSGEAEASG